MSIKKPYESWHRADISSHSRPLKPHSWARKLPDSPHLIPFFFFFFFSPPLSDFCSPSPSSLSLSYSPTAPSFPPSPFVFFFFFRFSIPPCSSLPSHYTPPHLPSSLVITPSPCLSSSRTSRRSWSWIGGVCPRLRAWLRGRRRSWQWPRRGCCCRRTSCRAGQVVLLLPHLSAGGTLTSAEIS